MSLVLRIVLAVLAGAITAGLLNDFGVLTAQLNTLIGTAVAILVFFSWDGVVPGNC